MLRASRLWHRNSIIISNVISSVYNLGSSYLQSAGNQLRSSSSPPTLRGVMVSITMIFVLALLCNTTYISYRRVVAKRKGDGNIRCVKVL